MTDQATQNSVYPGTAAGRSRWILKQRGQRRTVNPKLAYATLHEPELDAEGIVQPTNILFLTNTECPYRCLMCDLWKDTLQTPTAPGAIPHQIAAALAVLPAATQIKLYNAGSFFDPQAIPLQDHAAIAQLCTPFQRVVVECHPSLIGERTLAFSRQIPGKLEVAVGLETAHAPSLKLLNKGFTLDTFRRKAEFLINNNIDLRVFLLVKTPFMTEAEGVEHAIHSVDYSIECGASVCVVIPVRAGNGAVEAIAAETGWQPPRLHSLEAVHRYGVGLNKARVFADLWDSHRFVACEHDTVRVNNMEAMNANQHLMDAAMRLECCG